MNKGLSKSAWNTLKENIETYLVTTTIHGFRYLYEGRDWAERICWAVVLGLSFSAAVYTISHSFDEAAKEPILTTLHTAKIENVPFPAVTIGGDANVNKWGFAEKFFNFLTFYYPQVSVTTIYKKLIQRQEATVTPV